MQDDTTKHNPKLEDVLNKTPCIDSYCGGQGGTWEGDPENPEPVQCQYCYQERSPFIEKAQQTIKEDLLGLVEDSTSSKKYYGLNPSEAVHQYKAQITHAIQTYCGGVES